MGCSGKKSEEDEACDLSRIVQESKIDLNTSREIGLEENKR